MSDTDRADPSDEIDSSNFTERSLGYQVNLLARMMEHALARRIRQHGVVPGQFAQLLALYDADGQSVTELAATVAIEHPTMSRTLSRMERDGLVSTHPHPRDGRSRQIHLTDHARSLESTLVAEADAVNNTFLAALTPAQSEQLLDLLTAIVDAYDASTDED